jgi:hypothetical protein
LIQVIKTEWAVIQVPQIEFEVKKYELKYENFISLVVSLDLMICEKYNLYLDLLKRNRFINIGKKKIFLF